MNDHKYWLGFSLVSGIGPRRLANLLSWFGDLPSAWKAAEHRLQQAGLDAQPRANLIRLRAHIDLDAELKRVEAAGAHLLTLADDSYPTLLKTLPDPPIVLYIRGAVMPVDSNALSVVGTRKATHYGLEAAHKLSGALASQGITIISGLAQGIDTAAHQGALNAGGRTIAVLGSGIDQIYPAANRPLADEIAQNGAIISEFPLGAPPEGRNFPRRNRIISGIALGVLVIEAPEDSGALITANMAAEQGREVFAIPGNIFSSVSRGTNRLIQDGAKLVMSVSDILEELSIAHSRVETKTVAETIAPSSSIETQVLECLSADPLHIDDLVRACRLPIAQVSSTLTILELKGLARNVGPMQYCLVPAH